jgi:HK97 family phage major capsid protein
MSYIPRSGAEALMPEEFQREIIQTVPEMSSVMSLGVKAPNMSRAQRRIPVLSVLPTAYFLNPGPTVRSDSSDIALKKTTRLMWENKYLDAEELAVIVAIPEAVLDDTDYDIWAECKPKLLEAFGLAFDQAVYYGVNAPAVWPTNIVAAAIAAGNFVNLGSTGDIYDDILGENGVIAKIEDDGFMVTGHVASMGMRGRLRGLRDNVGNPVFKALYKEGVQGATRYELDGERMVFPRNGSIDEDRSLLITGDWTKLIYAIRKDITWKILDQAIIQDPTTGEILYNLPQMDMVAIRAVMRLAWQVPNPINRLKPDEDERYPFGVLKAAGS